MISTGAEIGYARPMVRAGSLVLFVLALVGVPACSSAPQCVIDTDCPVGQYCDNVPGGSGGSCVLLGGGGHDSGPRTDAGPTSDTGPARDTGPMADTGAHDTGAARDTGATPDTGATDDADIDVGP
jgi:hypothetical protein